MSITQAELYHNQNRLAQDNNQLPLKTTTTFSTSTVKLPLNIIILFDVHLLHRRTLTPDIIKGLYAILSDEKLLQRTDMLFIAGDLFDRLGYLTEEFLGDVITFLGRLLKKASEHDIVIRVLEGTPGHDYKQSRILQYLHDIINELAKTNVDVKFVDTLSIEYIEKFNMHLLYVPDEWNSDVFQTYTEAVELLQSRNLKQVDFCLFHGAFNYQINAALNPKAHNEDAWSSLVKHYLFAGHVHFRSTYKNIIVGGSFDRLAHGEEEPKGFIELNMLENGETHIQFHENKHATQYITLDVRHKQLEEILEAMEELDKTLPTRSHIRFYVASRDVIADGLKVLRQRYSRFFFTTKVEDTKKQQQQKTIKIVQDKFVAIELNPETIKRLISERVEGHGFNNAEDIIRQLDKYLQK